MINYATVGTSWITESFINSSRQISGLKLNAVYSRNKQTADAFAKKFGVLYTFTDIEEMAKSSLIDAVYIASPNSFHYKYAKLFLENKKHVICEKPIAKDGDLVRDLVSTSRKNGVVFIEAIKSMFTPGAEILKQAVHQIGRISQAYFSFLQLSSKYPMLKHGDIPNIFNPLLETGAVMDIGVYCLYPSLYLFGDCEKLISNAVFHKNGIDLCGDTVLCYADKNVTLSYSKIGNQRVSSQIIGDEGTVIIEKISNMAGIKIVDNNGNASELYPYCENEMYMKYEAEFFKNAINNYCDYKLKLDYLNDLSVLVCDRLKDIRVDVKMDF